MALNDLEEFHIFFFNFNISEYYKNQLECDCWQKWCDCHFNCLNQIEWMFTVTRSRSCAQNELW